MEDSTLTTRIHTPTPPTALLPQRAILGILAIVLGIGLLIGGVLMALRAR